MLLQENLIKLTVSRRSRKFLRKAAIILVNVLGAILITYLYLIKAIEHAYLQRGYEAYGGEYLIVPFVFYGAYKLVSLIIKVCGKVKKLRKEAWHAKGKRI